MVVIGGDMRAFGYSTGDVRIRQPVDELLVDLINQIEMNQMAMSKPDRDGQQHQSLFAILKSKRIVIRRFKILNTTGRLRQSRTYP